MKKGIKLSIFFLLFIIIAGGLAFYFLIFPNLKSDKEKIQAYTKSLNIKINKQKYDKKQNLKELVLSGDTENLNLSRFNHLNKVYLKGFKKLKVINLTNCNLTHLGLGGKPELNKIILRKQPIKETESYKNSNLQYVNLKFLPKLQELDLSNFNIKSIKLSGLTGLTSFNIQGNSKLTYIRLANMPKLKYANLSNCNLNRVTLWKLPELNELNISNNKNLRKLALINYPKLKKLNLSHYNLSRLTLKKMPELDELNISNNKNLRTLSLINYPKLKKLNLSHCNLSRLTLKKMPELVDINLSHNPKLKRFVIRDFPKLKKGDFSHCDLRNVKLEKVPELSSVNIKENKNLDEIDLSHLLELKELQYDKEQSNIIDLRLNKNNEIFPKVTKIEYTRDEKNRLITEESFDETDKYINFPSKHYAKIVYIYINDKKEIKQSLNASEAQKQREEEDLTKFRLTDVTFTLTRKKVYPSQVNDQKMPVLGLLEVENPLDEDIAIELKLMSKKFIPFYDSTIVKISGRIPLKPQEKKMINVYLPFSEKLWNNKRDQFINATLKITGRSKKTKRRVREHLSKINFLLTSVNKVTWDDFRNIAVFGSVDDPAVIELANAIPKLNDIKNPQIPPSIDQALKAYELIRAYKLKYSYMARRPDNEDSVLTPYQTIMKKIGKCTDTTILYASLLQRLGYSVVITTFTWEGRKKISHVMLLIDTGVKAKNWRFLHKDKSKVVTINDDSNCYIPIETTGLASGAGSVNLDFLSAWKKGVSQFNREYNKLQILDPNNTFRLGAVWKIGFKPIRSGGEKDYKSDQKALSKKLKEIKPIIQNLQKDYVKNFLESKKEYIQLKTSLEKDRNFKSLYNLAYYYLTVRRYYDSKSYFESAVPLNPNNLNALYYYTAVLAYVAFSPSSNLAETQKEEAKIDFEGIAEKFSQQLKAKKSSTSLKKYFNMNYDLSKWFNAIGNRKMSKIHEKLADKARKQMKDQNKVTYSSKIIDTLKEKGLSQNVIHKLQEGKISGETSLHIAKQGFGEKFILELLDHNYKDATLKKLTVKVLSEKEKTNYAIKSLQRKYIKDQDEIIVKGFSEETILAIDTKGFSETEVIVAGVKGFSEDESLAAATKGFSEETFDISK